jgi:hypothetical protein
MSDSNLRPDDKGSTTVPSDIGWAVVPMSTRSVSPTGLGLGSILLAAAVIGVALVAGLLLGI